MKIRLEWKVLPDDRSGRDYVTLDAKDIRRLCRDVAVKGEPYLVEVFHSDPLVPPTQSVRMIDGTICGAPLTFARSIPIGRGGKSLINMRGPRKK